MLRVGVIGTGAIGSEHIDRLTHRLSGAKVVALYDLYPESAEKVNQRFSLDAKIYQSDEELVASPDVDAVVITSLGEAHKGSILKAIKSKKLVFCEKPMTTTQEDGKAVVQAEMEAGKRLVQVGFMRRYDNGYQQLIKERQASMERQ